MLNKRLIEWKQELFEHARVTDQSEHDSLCDLMEQALNPLTEQEAEELMRSIGSYWIER